MGKIYTSNSKNFRGARKYLRGVTVDLHRRWNNISQSKDYFLTPKGYGEDDKQTLSFKEGDLDSFIESELVKLDIPLNLAKTASVFIGSKIEEKFISLSLQEERKQLEDVRHLLFVYKDNDLPKDIRMKWLIKLTSYLDGILLKE